ncbi:MAG: 50S ribosomal protein L15 [Parachlamydiales bacterium]
MLGRGVGSGHGKTSGRGNKGYGSRRGSTKRYGYEGGQKRLFTKLPRRGFGRGKFLEPVFAINLCKIEENFNDKEIVNIKSLYEKGIASRKYKDADLKILANGDLTKKVIIEANMFSKSALKKLEEKEIQFKQI